MILRGILGKRLEDYYLTNGHEKKQAGPYGSCPCVLSPHFICGKTLAKE